MNLNCFSWENMDILLRCAYCYVIESVIIKVAYC